MSDNVVTIDKSDAIRRTAASRNLRSHVYETNWYCLRLHGPRFSRSQSCRNH